MHATFTLTNAFMNTRNFRYCLPTQGAAQNGCAANYSAEWKVYLKPQAAGGEYTISARCLGEGCGAAIAEATLERVTMGDVYFCSGQSNMALPQLHSYSAKPLQADMLAGKYVNTCPSVCNI